MNRSLVAWVVAWVRRHQLVAYFALAYAISWLLVSPLIAAGLRIIRPGVPDVWHAFGALGPLLAAVVVTALVAGRGGLREMLASMGRWRVGVVWVFAALSPFALFIGSVLVLRLFGQPWPDLGLLAGKFGESAWLFGAFLASIAYGLGEEPGWRGFALPRLQRRWNALASASILALFWAIWHAPYFTYRYHLALMDVVFFFLGVLAGSIWLTCLYNSTGGSLLMVVLWHLSWNAVNVFAAVVSVPLVAMLTTEVIIAAVVVGYVWKPATLSPAPRHLLATDVQKAPATLPVAAAVAAVAAGRQAEGWQRFANPFVIWLLRSPLHGLLSSSMAALTVTGRKSGTRYTFPVEYVAEGDTWLVVSRRERAWWRNLTSDAPVTARLRGHDIACLGHAFTGQDEVTAGLLVLLRRSSRYQRAWSVRLAPDGTPLSRDDLARAAGRLVLVRLVPAVRAQQEQARREAAVTG